MLIYGGQYKISNQVEDIKNAINDWALTENGIAIVAENQNEALLPGFTNALGPKCKILFTGEISHGDESTRELLGQVQRDFDVMIERGKLWGSDPRNAALTTTQGPVKPFYDLVEACRDVIRGFEFPSPLVLNPPIYQGIRGISSDGRLVDIYIISFSVLMNIGRMVVKPPQLGGGQGTGNNADWVQLTDPSGITDNTNRN